MPKADESRVRQVKKRVETNSAVIEKIVDQLIGKHVRDLDKIISEIKDVLEKRDELSDAEIEGLTLRIPVYMYFMVSGLENLGIQKDSAKAVKMEAFNEAVLAVDGTIRDKESHAENETLNEYLVEMAFDRAYKKLKLKVDVCEQLCQASRKVLSKRIAELDINRGERGNLNPNRRAWDDDRKTKFRERVND